MIILGFGYINYYSIIYGEIKCLQKKHITKTASEKLLTIVGKMPVAHMARMNISGIWPSTNFMAQIATKVHAAKLLQNALLQQRKAVLQPRKQIQQLQSFLLPIKPVLLLIKPAKNNQDLSALFLKISA